jgi:hypothetical protein
MAARVGGQQDAVAAAGRRDRRDRRALSRRERLALAAALEYRRRAGRFDQPHPFRRDLAGDRVRLAAVDPDDGLVGRQRDDVDIGRAGRAAATQE